MPILVTGWVRFSTHLVTAPSPPVAPQRYLNPFILQGTALAMLPVSQQVAGIFKVRLSLALQENRRATWMTPASRVVLTRNPLFSNTFSIEMLSAKTSAVSSLSPT